MAEPIRLLPLTEVEALATSGAVTAVINAIDRVEMRQPTAAAPLQIQKAALVSVADKLNVKH